MHAPLKFGAHIWNAFTDWPTYLGTMQAAERLGYDSLWTPDHMYPSMGAIEGPMFESYTALAAVATMTDRATLGLLAGANTFRNPALVAKMITTVDHISRGRAVLGVGAGWHEQEHAHFGFPFGDGPPERLRWLREALPIMRDMRDGKRPNAGGEPYCVHEALNEPAQRPGRMIRWAHRRTSSSDARASSTLATDTSSSTSQRRTMRRR